MRLLAKTPQPHIIQLSPRNAYWPRRAAPRGKGLEGGFDFLLKTVTQAQAALLVRSFMRAASTPPQGRPVNSSWPRQELCCLKLIGPSCDKLRAKRLTELIVEGDLLAYRLETETCAPMFSKQAGPKLKRISRPLTILSG